MLAVTVNFTMWDNMIKDRIWFVFMKHLGSSKRRYRAEWSAQDVLRHWYCHLRWYQSFSTGDCFRHLPSVDSLSYLVSSYFCAHILKCLSPPLRSQSEKNHLNLWYGSCFLVTQPRACTTKKNTVINQYELRAPAAGWFKIVWGLTATYQSYCQFTAESGSS